MREAEHEVKKAETGRAETFPNRAQRDLGGGGSLRSANVEPVLIFGNGHMVCFLWFSGGKSKSTELLKSYYNFGSLPTPTKSEGRFFGYPPVH